MGIDIKQPEIQSNKQDASDMVKIIASAVAEALKQAIPAAAVGIDAAKSQADSKAHEKRIREIMARVQRCAICLLPVSACGGPHGKDKEGNEVILKDESGHVKYAPSANHISYYCGPSDESLFAWFQGVKINGVTFLAPHYGGQIWIPKKSDIPTIINNWERNERELSRARKAEGRGMNASGQPTQALGWR